VLTALQLREIILEAWSEREAAASADVARVREPRRGFFEGRERDVNDARTDCGGGAPAGAATPEYWSKAADSGDGTTLTYAVRGGGTQKAVSLLGGALVLGGAWAIWWLVAGGGLTVAGVVFLLVPAGCILLGVHCLDITLRAHTSYLLGKETLAVWRSALFGGTTLSIPRQSITGISHRYSPPGKSSPTGTAGTWVTAVGYRENGGTAKELVLDGLATREEARWLGPLFGTWAGVPLQRGFASGFQEADRDELPAL
jgi:hypothetical protein